MAAPTINFAGFVYDDSGDAVSGATIHIYDKNSTTTAREASSVTTNSSGYYSYTHATAGEFDVEIVKGTSKRRYKFDDKIHLSEIDVEKLSIRGNNGAIAGLYLYADQGDDVSDQWLIDAGTDGVLAFGNDAASQGVFADHVIFTPNSTIASSSVTIHGILDVNGSVDWDVTDVQVDSSGDIDLVSSSNTAAAIYLHQSTGTSGTIKIHADTGTSVTEGAESVNILSDVGGVGIRSTANLAKAVNITSDGGTTGSIAIFNDQGTSVTEGAESISLLSDAGGVGIRSTANLANAVNITVDGGTTSTMTLFNDLGTSVTEGAESIALLSDAGGVGIRSTANLAKAVNITSDGGTTGSIAIFNDQGTSVTEGAESISLLSDAGGIGIRSTADLANAVNVTVDGGTSSTITLFNDQGTTATEGAASIQLLSDVGGINVKSGLNGANAILLTADGGTSETIVIHADQGSGADSIKLLSDAGGITATAGGAIDVNATGAITIDGAGISIDSSSASNLTTSGGALTITSAAAATWSTAAGALTLDGTGGVAIQEGGSTIIGISDARALATTNTAAIDLDGSGAIQINSSGAAISIANDNVDQTVNLATAGTRTLNIGIGDGTDITTTVIKGTVEVGVNDTGYDVKFFGATDGSYMLWDESADKLDIVSATGGLLRLTSTDTSVSAADVIGGVEFYSSDSSGAGAKIGGHVKITAESVGSLLGDRNQMDFGVARNAAAATRMSLGSNGFLTLGGAVAADAAVIFDNGGTDYHIGIDQTADDLVIGKGTALGTTQFMGFNSDGNTGFGVTPYDNGKMSVHNDFGEVTASGHYWGVDSRITTSETGADFTGTQRGFNVEGRVGGSSDGAANTQDWTGTVGMRLINTYWATRNGSSGNVTGVAGLYVGNGAKHASGATVVNQYGIYIEDLTSGTNDYGLYIADADTYAIWVDAGVSRFDGTVFINDTANGNMTIGLTINQGAANDQILAFKSSDVSHGLTSAHLLKATEIDDYGVFTKASDAYGGLGIIALAEDNALTTVFQMGVFGGTPSTDKSDGCRGLAEITAYEHDGGDGLANITADGNVFAVRARVGGSPVTRFMVDEDGQIYAVAAGHTGDLAVGALSDSYDDAQLVRALDHAKTSAGVKGMVKDKWDDFIKYNEQDLIDAGVLGETMENGGLLNVTGLQKLHNGAIWQGYTRQMELQEEVTELKSRLLALEGAK